MKNRIYNIIFVMLLTLSLGGVLFFGVVRIIEISRIQPASSNVMQKFKWHTPTAAFVKDVNGDIVKINMNALRGFYNVNNKVYVIYLSDKIITTDSHGICRIINARYGIEAPCYLGEHEWLL